METLHRTLKPAWYACACACNIRNTSSSTSLRLLRNLLNLTSGVTRLLRQRPQLGLLPLLRAQHLPLVTTMRLQARTGRLRRCCRRRRQLNLDRQHLLANPHRRRREWLSGVPKLRLQPVAPTNASLRANLVPGRQRAFQPSPLTRHHRRCQRS